jgi:undecaprenyl-diphosphatase
MTLDWDIFRVINGFAGAVPPLDVLMRLLVNEYFVPTTISLVLLALWFGGASPEQRRQNQRALLYTILGLLVANLFVKGCNLLYFRPRPFAAHEVNLLFYQPTDSSFPSNPATVGFAFATGIWLFGGRIEKWRPAALLYVLAALFALARVYCGVHYPSDVIVGAAIGFSAAYLVKRIAKPVEPLINLVVVNAHRLFLA